MNASRPAAPGAGPAAAGSGVSLRRWSAAVLFLLLAVLPAHAQVFTNKVVGKSNQAYLDSLRPSAQIIPFRPKIERAAA